MVKRSIIMLAVAAHSLSWSTSSNARHNAKDLLHENPQERFLSKLQASPIEEVYFFSSSRQNFADKNVACGGKLFLHFDKPITVATLLGKVIGLGQYQQKKPFYVEQAFPDFRRFILKLSTKGGCSQVNAIKSLTIADSVYNTLGEKLSRPISIPISAIPWRQSPYMPGLGSFRSMAASEALSFSSSTVWLPRAAASCLPRGETCLQVTAARLNRAFQAVALWKQTEKTKPWYQKSLALMPLEGVILQPFKPLHRPRQYAHPDMIFHLRRAAVFMSALFPELRAIPLADISNQAGQTPAVNLGQESVLLHPQGSHRYGKDADVSYITFGNGNEAGKGYAWERNFWFVYSLLQSSGVDLMMSAYKQQFLALARKAYSQGLITDLALGRMNLIMEDHGLNHDKHLHIAIKNLDNQQISRKFHPADDVYSCYQALRPSHRGGNLNFCD